MKCPQCETDVTPVYKQSLQLSWIAIVIFCVLTQGWFLIPYGLFRAWAMFYAGHHACPLCNHDFGRATKYLNDKIVGR